MRGGALFLPTLLLLRRTCRQLPAGLGPLCRTRSCKSKPLFHHDLGLAKRERVSFVRESWISLVLNFQASFDALAYVEELIVV